MPLTEGLVSRKMCVGPPKQGYAEKRKKKSYVTTLKFNPNHDTEDGRFTSGTGGSGSSSQGSKSKLTPAQQAMQATLERQSKKPVYRVKSVEEAVVRVLKGDNVEIQDTKHVHTLLKKLGEMAIAAKAANKKALNFDPCVVTVKGVSLFCTEKIKTAEFPHGVPRIEMPQFKSKNPTPDSEADKLPRNDEGEVDGSQAFLKHLKQTGVETDPNALVPARKLKASQAEMEGVKVAGMMLNPERDPKKAKIWVSKDNYVIDGHHTWAAAIGRDAEDGNLDNDKMMEVVKVDLPMSEIYHMSVAWTRAYGLPAAGVKKYDRILKFN